MDLGPSFRRAPYNIMGEYMATQAVAIELGFGDKVPATLEPITARHILPSDRLQGSAESTDASPLASQNSPVVLRSPDGLELLNPRSALRGLSKVGPGDRIISWVIERETLSSEELTALARFVYAYLEPVQLGGRAALEALIDRLDDDPWLKSTVARRYLGLDKDRLSHTDIANLIGDPTRKDTIRKYRRAKTPKSKDFRTQEDGTSEDTSTNPATKRSPAEADNERSLSQSPSCPMADKAAQMEGYERARQAFSTAETRWKDLYDLLCQIDSLEVPEGYDFESWPEIVVTALIKESDPSNLLNRLRHYVQDHYQIPL